QSQRHQAAASGGRGLPALLELMGWDAVPEALALLPPELAEQYLLELGELALGSLLPLPSGAEAFAVARARSVETLSRLIAVAALSGAEARASSFAERLESSHPEALSARALSALVLGEVAAARVFAASAVRSLPQAPRAVLRWLEHPLAPWVLLLLVTSPEPALVELGLFPIGLCASSKGRPSRVLSYRLLQQLRRHVDAGEPLHLDPSRFAGPAHPLPGEGWVELCFAALCSRWSSAEEPLWGPRFDALVRHAEQQGLFWLARELGVLAPRTLRAL